MRFKKLKVARILGGALGLLLALSLVLVPSSVLAVQGIPHWFNGTVTMNTEPAPEGTVISARIDGIEYASAQVDAAGRYGDDPLFYVPADDPDTPGKEGGVAGDTVEFYVSDTLGGQYVFEVWGITELNLIVGEAPPSVLTAEAGGPYSGIEGESIALSGSASSGTSPYTYAWDLDNDGAYDDATGASPSYSWSTAGSYTIGLQVTDSASATATDTATVTVTEVGALTAEAGGPYSGTEGESIALSGSATGGTAPYTFAWDLDNDGAYDDATGASPSNSWSTAGTYTIGLQVTDSTSATAVDTATVTVEESAFDPLVYDTNGDGEISKAEALAAITDYLAGTITKNDVLAVVILYFS